MTKPEGIVRCPSCGANNHIPTHSSGLRPIYGQCKTPLDALPASKEPAPKPNEQADQSSEAESLFSGRVPILKALEKMRLRLLDLTMRNRLLNFKHSPGRCIQFVDAQPNLVFRRFMGGTDKKIILLPIPEPHRSEWIQIAGRLTKPEAKDYAIKVGVNPSFELPLINQQTNGTNNVRALYYPEELERHCRKLNRVMKSAIEETGANMLFLVFGFLEFPEKGPAERTMMAPLISVPVIIEKGDLDRETRHYRYHIVYSGEELTENLSPESFSEFDLKPLDE